MPLRSLNGTLANSLAAAFAQRLEHETQGEPGAMAALAYGLALGRAPSTEERQLAVAFLHDNPVKEFALAMFNLNAFLYVP